jgi:hypothetical protein
MPNIDDLTDVLYPVELTVLAEWEREPSLLDLEVADVYAALARRYVLEDRAQSYTLPRLSDKARRLHDVLLDVSEALLGRHPAPYRKLGAPFRTDVKPSELATCFKRLNKSVATWSERGGRQGYLEYIAQFVPR